jgi:uncharacterized RDD family membrane protein YckC
MITVLKENIPHGPFSRAEIEEKLARGEITPDSLAFVEGLAQWTPLRDVLARMDAAARPLHMPPPPPIATIPIGTGYATAGPIHPPGAMPIGTCYSYAATMQPPSHLVYAGFWLRFVAIFIDGIILSPLVFVYIGIYFAASAGDQSVRMTLDAVLFVGWVIIGVSQWLYFALLESSRRQATLGKQLMGIQVTARQGTRIRFGQATGRYFAKIVSGFTLYIGFMMAGWTQRKQALHDMLADTLVVRKPDA